MRSIGVAMALRDGGTVPAPYILAPAAATHLRAAAFGARPGPARLAYVTQAPVGSTTLDGFPTFALHTIHHACVEAARVALRAARVMRSVGGVVGEALTFRVVRASVGRRIERGSPARHRKLAFRSRGEGKTASGVRNGPSAPASMGSIVRTSIGADLRSGYDAGHRIGACRCWPAFRTAVPRAAGFVA